MSTHYTPPDREPPTTAHALERRGTHHGFVDDASLAITEDPAAAWQRGAPIALPGVLQSGVDMLRPEIRSTLAMFDRLRDGARWLDECDRRVADVTDFRYASSTVDQLEPREIERLFIDALDEPDGYRGRDITARLSWIADDEADLSLRIRFSFGHESLREWLDPEDPRSDLADEFAERVFPECQLLTHPALLEQIRNWHGAPARMSERIVYSNAPGGGAVFHHDADPSQRGVAFAQLAGATAWLALPRRDLAAAVAAETTEFGDADAVSERFDAIDEPLWALLNHTPEFTARLARDGALRVVHAGDVLVLPSPTPDRTAWHSVFALGEAPSLALSFGLFDQRAST